MSQDGGSALSLAGSHSKGTCSIYGNLQISPTERGSPKSYQAIWSRGELSMFMFYRFYSIDQSVKAAASETLKRDSEIRSQSSVAAKMLC